MARPFRAVLREASTSVWEAIFAHPFLKELGDGTLDRQRFLFFVRQDALYLQDFARVLCLGGARADSLETLDMFAEHAATVVRVERSLHTSWSEKLGISSRELSRTVRAPITQAYTRHMLAVAQVGSLAEIVATILPCYWIYWEVGKRLKTRMPTEPLYAEWIQAYSAEGFGAHVEQQLGLIDRLAAECTAAEREKMIEHFVDSSRYEYLFWNQAYRQEQWPV